jgi:uncharacterized protein Usg
VPAFPKAGTFWEFSADGDLLAVDVLPESLLGNAGWRTVTPAPLRSVEESAI